jgi:hypothetical protein
MGSNPGKGAQNAFGALLNTNSIDKQCYLSGAKQQIRAVEHSTPYCAKVNNEWSWTSSPHICLMVWTGNII